MSIKVQISVIVGKFQNMIKKSNRKGVGTWERDTIRSS